MRDDKVCEGNKSAESRITRRSSFAQGGFLLSEGVKTQSEELACDLPAVSGSAAFVAKQ